MAAGEAEDDGRGAGRIVMATVKGDVHDIGKNIVGVVLRCNGYDVVDLGVMVQAERILEAALENDADLIGLSGLITPSLDEMVHVAQLLERHGWKKPLLIGGATTSRRHTAVKIAPTREAPTVHVDDASRAVGVIGALRTPEQRTGFLAELAGEQERLRSEFEAKSAVQLVSYATVRERRLQLPFDGEATPAVPEALGVFSVDDQPLAELVDYIDWTPFFHTWELRGVFPQILDHPRTGAAAREVYEHAQALLRTIVDEKLLTARGVYAFFAAVSEGDDLLLFGDESRERVVARLAMPRQQRERDANKPLLSLADYVAPKASGIRDYVGAFAVCTGHGLDALVSRFEAEHDDYKAIMAKALADRLAEAFAERLHQRVRQAWGYGADEELSPRDLVRERYRGIRPAPGYPACPDHSDKELLFRLLEVPERAGITLTESFAMMPTAAVSGLYFSHPSARYFAVGKIGRDQVEDIAQRRGQPVEETERWLRPNLAYEP